VNILALDTATESCNVGVWLNGEVRERQAPGRQHAEQLLQMIRELLAEADLVLAQLDAIAFGRGPGMFTGLRIGAGITQGLAFALDIPVVPVSSLAALAHGCDGEHVLAAIDARMDQVYWGMFRRRKEGVELLGEERVTAPTEVRVEDGADWIGCGSGWDRYGRELDQTLAGHMRAWHGGRSPLASDVATLAEPILRAGGGMAAEEAVPVYVRDDVARKPTAI
jgi:tRNA threonylcarbamoyladenosine biosynthesis protein TsaB